MMISSERRAKINWHCRRGMLELDLIFQRFLKQGLESLTQDQLNVFEQLLSHQDPDLYAWLMGYESPVEKELVDIVALIRLHDNIK